MDQKEAEGKAGVTNAFTDMDAGIIHLDEARGDPGTSIHEALHLHSSKAWVEGHHTKINEGITELFTRRVCEKSKVERGGDYQEHLNAVEALLQHTTVEALAQAFFKNDTSAVEADLATLSPNLWTDWQIAMAKSMSGATLMLSKLPH